MNSKKAILGISLVAVAALFAFTPLASAVTNIVSGTITTDGTTVDATIVTDAKINKGGQDGAFGYGVLTGGDSIMVTTTHKGVLDSEKQGGDPNSPVWHNHIVGLNTMADSRCADTVLAAKVEVATLSFESPGKAKIIQEIANMESIPGSFSGTNALTNTAMTWNPGTTADTLVSFTLKPLFDGGVLTHVCVEDIAPFPLM